MKEKEWSKPTSLYSDRSSLINYPANALPPILRDMAFAISESTSTDVAMARTALISSVSNFNGRYSNNIPNLDLILKSYNGETYIKAGTASR